jgi:epithelial splicing regulatory protein 1/2
MDSEHSAFAAAQMRHHRFMVFGKKQRYIEVFQCSGEHMKHVLFGGLPTAQTPLSPVGKPLLSPGMLNTTTLLPTPAANSAALTAAAAAAAASMPPNAGAHAAAAAAANHQAAAAHAHAAALMPPQSAAALAWDQFSSAAVALQMQQAALAQAQAQAQYRSQTENHAWVMNQLAAQQQLQMQLAAFANAQKVQPWNDLNAAAAAHAAAAASSNPALLTLPHPPPSMAPISQMVQTTQASAGAMTNHAAAKPKPASLMPPAAMYPVSSALHLPQAASVATTAPNQPFVFINMPRFSSPAVALHPSSYPPKVTGITSTSTVNQAAIPSAAFNLSSNPLISSSAQYAASSLLKRSWEHAFPDSIAAAQNASGVSVKRPYTIANVGNSAGAIFTMPPPQQPTAPISSQPPGPAVAFQQAPFFTPT